MNLLFICTENKLRSATAEAVFNEYENLQAIGCGTNKDAITPVSGDLIDWADIVFPMQKSHLKKISKKFESLLNNKRVICLDIPDNYDYMDERLVEILQHKLSAHIELKEK